MHRKPRPLQLCSAGLQTGSDLPSFQDSDSGNTAPADTDPRSRTRGAARGRLGLPLAPGRAALLRGGEGQAPSRGMEMSPISAGAGQAGHRSVLGRIGHTTHLNSARSTVESHLGLTPLIAGVVSAVQGSDRCQEGKGPAERGGTLWGSLLAGWLLSLDKDTQGGFAVPRPWGYRGGGLHFHCLTCGICRSGCSEPS